MDKNELDKLSKIELKIPTSENNVKYKIVIPFLQSFNHRDFDFEHAAQGSRIDINIGNKIIIETKALNVNLEQYVQQLSDYCKKESPILALLINGKRFIIFSPLWKKQKDFADKKLYDFELQDLSNESLVSKLDKILDFSNYESDDFIEYIEDRKREIIKAQKEIALLEEIKNQDIESLRMRVIEFKKAVEDLSKQIEDNEQELDSIIKHDTKEISGLKQAYLLPLKRNPYPEKIKRQINKFQTTGDNNGIKLVLKNIKKDVNALGMQMDKSFRVFAGSTVSSLNAPNFQKSVPGAYQKRKEYERRA